jgi:hypothetical protein
MVAARMVMPFLQEAQTGRTPDLPPGVKHLSINQMAEFVLSDVGLSDAQNVESRVWRPSKPVIHLAAAIAVFGQGMLRAVAQPLSIGDLVQTRWIIETVVQEAQEIEVLIAKSQRLRIAPESLIRVRLS